MITSVSSGRCGPCASIAPTGRIATTRARSRSRASSHVMETHSRVGIEGGSVSSGSVRGCQPPGRRPYWAANGKRTMTLSPPERRNIADLFLDARLREGRGERPAVLTDSRAWTYAEIHDLANRYGNLLAATGADPEDRILIALPDGPDFVGALFGTLKIGAVAVMANPGLPAADAAA